MPDTATENRMLRAALAGGRDAFRLVVERYQSLVWAIIYSETTDLQKSLGLACQTFARAFNGRAQLKDASALRPWLVRIARNIVNRYERKRRFDVILNDLPPGQAPSPNAPPLPLPTPPISTEQQAFLRRALAEVPREYREALTLFCCSGRSLALTAADLDLSEDTLKHRLALARELLGPQTTPLVEEILGRTAPTESFSDAVLAALDRPAPIPEENASSHPQTARPQPHEVSALPQKPAHPGAGAFAADPPAPAVGVGLSGELAEEQIFTAPQLPCRAAAPAMSRPAVYAAFAGAVLGGIAWTLSTSFMARDWPAAVAVLVAAVLVFAAGTYLCLHNQTRRWRILAGTVISLCALNLAVINLRWNLWRAALSEAPGYAPAGGLSRWSVNIVGLSIMGVLLVLLLHSRRRQTNANSTQANSAC